MPWYCSVCARPDVREVNDALVRGMPRRACARKYDIHHSTLDRHWWVCVPEDVHAAAEAAGDAGSGGVDVLDGRAMLEAMQQQLVGIARVAGELEQRMMNPDLEVDTRSVVAAFGQVRASIESLAKLTFAVQDRPAPVEESDRPELDEAIFKALMARGIGIEEPTAAANVVERGLALPAAPSVGT